MKQQQRSPSRKKIRPLLSLIAFKTRYLSRHEKAEQNVEGKTGIDKRKSHQDRRNRSMDKESGQTLSPAPENLDEAKGEKRKRN